MRENYCAYQKDYVFILLYFLIIEDNITDLYNVKFEVKGTLT